MADEGRIGLLALVNLTQSAMLAPLVPLADALALTWSSSTTRGNSGAFEYGLSRNGGVATPPIGQRRPNEEEAKWTRLSSA